MDELTKAYFENLNQQERSALAEYNLRIEFESLLEMNFEQYTQKAIKLWLRENLDRKEWLTEKIKNWKFKKYPGLRISQSLMKSFWSYANGEVCGKRFKESLFDNAVSVFDTSPAMVAGQVFEYWATGQTNYTGDVPDEDTLKKADGTLSKAGETAKAQAENWKKFVRKNRYTRVKTGLNLRYETDTYVATSLPDVGVKSKQTSIIIDLKYGDPDNGFGDFAWSDNTLPYKDKLLLQAKQNLFLWYKLYNEKAEFIFYIASKSKETNAKARKIVFKDFDKMLIEQETLIETTYKGLSFLLEHDLLMATPELKYCSSCNVKECSSKTDVANIKTIEI